MVITTIGYVLLAVSVLAVLAFCWLIASCLSLRRPQLIRRSTGALATIAGTRAPQMPGYGGPTLFRGPVP